MAPKAPDDTSLRSQVYDWLRDALTTGRFAPGQKLSFRFIAGTLGVSLTPVREAIRRLVAEGAFEMQPNRSVRVPLMTRDRILELRDIRMARRRAGGGEGRRRSPTARADRELRRIAQRARSRPAAAATPRRTAAKIREFHFALYAIAGQPTLLRVIEGLWLQTGPYMNLLYPDFISLPRGPRDAGCGSSAPCRRTMRSRHGGKSRTISVDALSYVADLADDAGISPRLQAGRCETPARRGLPAFARAAL